MLAWLAASKAMGQVKLMRHAGSAQKVCWLASKLVPGAALVEGSQLRAMHTAAHPNAQPQVHVVCCCSGRWHAVRAGSVTRFHRAVRTARVMPLMNLEVTNMSTAMRAKAM